MLQEPIDKAAVKSVAGSGGIDGFDREGRVGECPLPPADDGAAFAKGVDGDFGAITMEPVDDLLRCGVGHPAADHRLGDDGHIY